MSDYFERKLDDKRRLTIPADIRNEFASGVVVTRGFGKYLHLYARDIWFTIDQSLLDYAGISKDIVAVRVGQYWRLVPADDPSL